ncbi:MAG: class I SAM-dependent methyltransferase [Armatimonadota bacterium]|jgi:ubiquinone/menaquinone biosynthesis C-methylase UbiE
MREDVQGAKVRTRYVATQGVKEYRATIEEYVKPDDVVLEVGCEWGTTTVLLAERCKEVIAVDIGKEPIERARQRHPDLRFEQVDAYDMKAILSLGRSFDKVYVDLSGLSGYHSLLDLLSLLNMYTAVLRPEVIVVKSSALKNFAHRCIPWQNPPRSRAG